jgi:acyl-CoA thioester hydrolase
MREGLTLCQYPLQSAEKLRYADTDRLGHINNTVFPMLFETGHAELLYGDGAPALEPSCFFVIVRFVIEFVGEANWPGMVDIGTKVIRLGRSSAELDQAMFQDGRRVATAKSVITLYDDGNRRSRPLSQATLRYLSLFGTVDATRESEQT